MPPACSLVAPCQTNASPGKPFSDASGFGGVAASVTACLAAASTRAAPRTPREGYAGAPGSPYSAAAGRALSRACPRNPSAWRGTEASAFCVASSITRQDAHVRVSRTRSGALGSPRSVCVGFGAQPRLKRETSRGAGGAAGEESARGRSFSAGGGISSALAFPSVSEPGIR